MAGGGIGEAALIGAAVSGGSAALRGQDPLKAALIGGALGGAGGAVFGGAGAGAGAGSGAGAGAGAGAYTYNPLFSNATTAATPTAANAVPSVTGGLESAAPGVNPIVNQMASGQGANIAAAGDYTGAGLNLSPYMSPTANAVPAVDATAASTTAAKPSIFQQAKDFYNRQGTLGKIGIGIGGSTLLSELMTPGEVKTEPESEEFKRAKKALAYYKFNPKLYRPAYADGGITTLASGGYDRMVGETPMYQEMASGGISSLGDYSDGGRLLRGPGDGVSDDIPAQIGQRRPARLADGEFVVPARIVSELGNGSTDAGARQLYAMMDRVQANRRKTIGKDRVAVNSKANKYLPA